MYYTHAMAQWVVVTTGGAITTTAITVMVQSGCILLVVLGTFVIVVLCMSAVIPTVNIRVRLLCVLQYSSVV